MPYCCVPGCTSGNRRDENIANRHFFYVPCDVTLRSAWNKAVARVDRRLTDKSRVCDLHFREQDILKTYVHVINGETVHIPRGKWCLAKDAVPKVFPNAAASCSKPPGKKRRSRCQTAKRPAQHRGSQCNYHGQPEDMNSALLPSGWRMTTPAHDNSDASTVGKKRSTRGKRKKAKAIAVAETQIPQQRSELSMITEAVPVSLDPDKSQESIVCKCNVTMPTRSRATVCSVPHLMRNVASYIAASPLMRHRGTQVKPTLVTRTTQTIIFMMRMKPSS